MFDRIARASPRRIEQHRSKAVKLVHLQRIAEQIAVQRVDLPAGPRACALARQMGIAGGLDRQHLGWALGERKGESAKP